MKAKLEFDLDDSDDALNLKRALKALDFQLCLEDLSSWLRDKEKYTNEREVRIDALRKIFWSKISEYRLEEFFD